VGTRAAKVRTPITSGRQDSLVRPESVKSAVLHVEGNDTNALTVLHDQIKGKVFNEEVGVVAERLAVESVQQGMTGTVRPFRTLKIALQMLAGISCPLSYAKMGRQNVRAR